MIMRIKGSDGFGPNTGIGGLAGAETSFSGLKEPPSEQVAAFEKKLDSLTRQDVGFEEKKVSASYKDKGQQGRPAPGSNVSKADSHVPAKDGHVSKNNASAIKEDDRAPKADRPGTGHEDAGTQRAQEYGRTERQSSREYGKAGRNKRAADDDRREAKRETQTHGSERPCKEDMSTTPSMSSAAAQPGADEPPSASFSNQTGLQDLPVQDLPNAALQEEAVLQGQALLQEGARPQTSAQGQNANPDLLQTPADAAGTQIEDADIDLAELRALSREHPGLSAGKEAGAQAGAGRDLRKTQQREPDGTLSQLSNIFSSLNSAGQGPGAPLKAQTAAPMPQTAAADFQALSSELVDKILVADPAYNPRSEVMLTLNQNSTFYGMQVVLRRDLEGQLSIELMARNKEQYERLAGIKSSLTAALEEHEDYKVNLTVTVQEEDEQQGYDPYAVYEQYRHES